MSKGDKDNRSPNIKKRRENQSNIKGLNNFKPFWMKKDVGNTNNVTEQKQCY